MKKFDIYRASLAAGDVTTIEMDKLVKKFGFNISYSKGWPNLSGVKRLYDAYEDGVLNEVLTIIGKAWNENKEALKASTIGGLWQFFKRFPSCDTNRCINKFHSCSPARFEQNG